MFRFFKKILYATKIVFRPSEIEKEKRRWDGDGGDDKLRYNYKLDSSSFVIDVGGYEGSWSDRIFEEYNCSICIIEPVSEYYNTIKKRFINNDKIKVYPIAYGARTREEYISLCDDGTSLYRNTTDKEKIKYVDIFSFFDQYNITKVDLMKINIEGGEYEILPRLIETGLINKIQNLQIQFHDILPHSEKKMEEIKRALLKTHEPTYQYKYIWENWIIKNERSDEK